MKSEINTLKILIKQEKQEKKKSKNELNETEKEIYKIKRENLRQTKNSKIEKENNKKQ